ncbi:MAG TPA: hypothetical protein VMZ01_06280, partial [Aestuariivirga sp.]|nr:hypothetical protein [Aestuariivirga sp.]
ENADELEKALTKTVETTAETPPEPAVSEFNFTGHVTMGAGVELPRDFNSPAWEFFTSVNGAKGQSVKTEYGADLKTKIETAGDYIGKISDDAAVVEVPFTLVDGKAVTQDVSLEAGVLRLSGKLDETAKLEDKAAAWELLDSSGAWIATKYGAEASFLANAGSYKLRLSLGAAKAEQDVTVSAGKIEDVVIMLGAGIIQATAVFAPGGPAVPDSAAIELRKGEAALDGSHEWIATTYGSATQFNVPAGKYLVVVNQDYATGSAAVEVKPAGVAKVEVALNAGFLAVTGPTGSTIEVFAGEKDISGARKHIATEYNGALNKAFNAGSYHVVAKDGEGKVIGEKGFEVKPGQRTEGVIP